MCLSGEIDWTGSAAAAKKRADRIEAAIKDREHQAERLRRAGRGEIIDAEIVDVAPAQIAGPSGTKGAN